MLSEIRRKEYLQKLGIEQCAPLGMSSDSSDDETPLPFEGPPMRACPVSTVSQLVPRPILLNAWCLPGPRQKVS